MASGDLFQGRRVRDKEPHELEPGDYGKWDRDGGRWHARTPNGHSGNLGGHEVKEHADGTITVSPSILVSDAERDLWHGYLEHGVWREC